MNIKQAIEALDVYLQSESVRKYAMVISLIIGYHY